MVKTKQLEELLKQTSKMHHDAFTESKGVDRDWPMWYSEWLLNGNRLANVLGYITYEAKLIYALMAVDIDYTRLIPNQDWPQYYAENLDKYLLKVTSN